MVSHRHSELEQQRAADITAVRALRGEPGANQAAENAVCRRSIERAVLREVEQPPTDAAPGCQMFQDEHRPINALCAWTFGLRHFGQRCKYKFVL